MALLQLVDACADRSLFSGKLMFLRIIASLRMREQHAYRYSTYVYTLQTCMPHIVFARGHTT